MRAVFVHDHRFKRVGDAYYSEGKFGPAIWDRYLAHAEHLTVVARAETMTTEALSNYDLASGDQVKFECFPAITAWDRLRPANIDRALSRIIEGSTHVICRLPSFLGLRAFYMAPETEKRHPDRSRRLPI